MSRTVFALIPAGEASALWRKLLDERGFLRSNLSVLFVDGDGLAPTDSLALDAWFGRGARPVRIAGGGALLASGPVLATLAAPSPGASLAEALVRLGIDASCARTFAAAVRGGDVLVGARAVDLDQLDEARRAIDAIAGSVSTVVRTRRAPMPTAQPLA